MLEQLPRFEEVRALSEQVCHAEAARCGGSRGAIGVEKLHRLFKRMDGSGDIASYFVEVCLVASQSGCTLEVARPRAPYAHVSSTSQCHNGIFRMLLTQHFGSFSILGRTLAFLDNFSITCNFQPGIRIELACLERQLAVSGVAVAGSDKRPSRLLGLALKLELYSGGSEKLGCLFERCVSLC